VILGPRVERRAFAERPTTAFLDGPDRSEKLLTEIQKLVQRKLELLAILQMLRHSHLLPNLGGTERLGRRHGAGDKQSHEDLALPVGR